MPASFPTTSFKLKRTTRPGVLGAVFDLDTGPDGGPQLVEGSKELAQALELRLLMVRGEAWEDTACGLPWFSFLGQKPPNEPLFRVELLRELRKDLRVRQVDSIYFRYDQARRHQYAEAYCTARDGAKVRVEV